MFRSRSQETSRDREPERGSRRGRDEPERESRGRGRDDDRGGRSSGRSSFQYEGRSREDVTKRSTSGANEFDKYLIDAVRMFKPSDKDNEIRILPPTWEKPKHYGLDIWVHYGVGPDRQTYLCLHKMKGEACPICEERQLAVDDGDEAHAKQLEPKRRVLVYLIDRANEKEGLQAWAMPWTVDRDICAISVDKKSGEVLPIDHPDEGYDIEFEKKGAKDRTEYVGMRIARRDSALGNNRWLDEAVECPIPETLVYFDYDHIAKAFGGGGALKDRGSRDDPPGRDREDPPARGGRDPERGRGRDEKKAELTWVGVHEMVGAELDFLVDDERLDIDLAKFDSDEELADAICEELKINKPSSGRRRVVEDDKPADEGGRDRLASMRERRERGGR